MVSLEELLGSGNIDKNMKNQLKDLDKKKRFLMLMKSQRWHSSVIDGVRSIEESYGNLANSSAGIGLLKIYCLEQKLELMNEFENLKSWQFLGIRAKTNFEIGIEKEEPNEKKKHFMLAYRDLEKEIELKNIFFNQQPLSVALYKTAEVCSSLSNYLSDPIIERALKLEVIEKGLDSIKKLRESRDHKENFKIKYMHSFFYLRKAGLVEERNIYMQGIELLKGAIQSACHGDLDEKVCSYSAQAFSEAYKIKTGQEDSEEATIDNLKEGDLENLILAIVCSELTEQFGNHRKENYQAIAREYYNLQFLIEQAYRRQTAAITLEGIKDKVKSVFNMTNNYEQRIFGNYNGGLLEIIDKTTQLENDPDIKKGMEMQFIALEHSLNAFEKSYNDGKGDNSLGNMSYRGMCITDLAKLNNWLDKISKEEIEKKLEYAEKLLKSALNNRKTEKPKDLYKDYRRLAECQFRLADLSINQVTKRKLYRQSIYNNFEAKKLLREKIGLEVYSFIASSFSKLAEISYDEDLRSKYLKKATKYFEGAKDAGDNSPENRSKKGNCYLKLLEIELREKRDAGLFRRISDYVLNLFKPKKENKIEGYIKNAKKSLEEAVRINDNKKGYFVYPLVLLYYLAKDIEEDITRSRNLGKYGLRKSKEYIEDALQVYTSNKEWAVKQLSESANFVCKSQDNYGLLDDTFVFKREDPKKPGSLEAEIEITEKLREVLREEIGNKKYITPKSLCIVAHEDKDKRLSGRYYAMTMKHGISLDDFLMSERKTEDEKFSILKDVVDYLAFIHANITKNYESEDYSKKIEGKLYFIEKTLNILGIRDLIFGNYAPLLNNFQGATLVYNKDAHPENWIVSHNKKIVAIDFEDRGMVPIEFDLVNLLEYGDYNLDNKGKYFQNYANAFKQYASSESFEIDNLRYLNALIHRSISLVSAWSLPEREKMKKRRKSMVERALNAINRIENEFNGYYSQYSDNYLNLKKGLQEISNAV